jgi:hypothetical protein
LLEVELRLAAFRAQSELRQGRRLRAAPWAIAVCLLLAALVMVAQVAHFHAFDSDADQCPLCIVLHSAAPVAAAAAMVVLVSVERRVVLAQAPVVCHRAIPTLFIRPPPAAC